MTEHSRPWAGTTIGDAGPYTAPDWWDVWQSMVGGHGAIAGAGTRGVFHSVAGELLVTYIGPNFLTVERGAAMADGLFFYNDALKNVTVTSATAGNVRDDRLVIRKYFSGLIQTARIVLVAGSEAASPGPGTPPALVQDFNRQTYWDIPLARVSVADNGVITLTDERSYVDAVYKHVMIPAMGWNTTTSKPNPKLPNGGASPLGLSVVPFLFPDDLNNADVRVQGVYQSDTGLGTGDLAWYGYIACAPTSNDKAYTTKATAGYISVTPPAGPTYEKYFLSDMGYLVADLGAESGDLIKCTVGRMGNLPGDTLADDVLAWGVMLSYWAKL